MVTQCKLLASVSNILRNSLLHLSTGLSIEKSQTFVEKIQRVIVPLCSFSQTQWILKKAIVCIAQQLGHRRNCIALGKELNASGEPMARVDAKTNDEYSPSDAYDMLNVWLQSAPPEPGKALHSALIEIELASIADKLKDILLTQCKWVCNFLHKCNGLF